MISKKNCEQVERPAQRSDDDVNYFDIDAMPVFCKQVCEIKKPKNAPNRKKKSI
jgi:hypothetical protein